MSFSRGLLIVSMLSRNDQIRTLRGKNGCPPMAGGVLSSTPGLYVLRGCCALKALRAEGGGIHFLESWLWPRKAVHPPPWSDEPKPHTSKLVSFS